MCGRLFIIKLAEQEIKYEVMAKCIFVIDQKMYENSKGLRAWWFDQHCKERVRLAFHFQHLENKDDTFVDQTGAADDTGRENSQCQ